MQQMQETEVQSLGWEDPLAQEMATLSTILAQKMPWTEEPCRVQPMGSQGIRQDGAAEHMHIWIYKVFYTLELLI